MLESIEAEQQAFAHLVGFVPQAELLIPGQVLKKGVSVASII